MANNIHDAFDSIKADSRLKESTKQFLSQRRTGNAASPRRHGPQKMLATICVLLLFVTGFWGYTWTQTPVSYVSIDVNPSVELALNRLDRVVGVAAFNADGKALIEDLSLNGKKYTDAINLIVESDAMKGYLLDDAELVFTVAASGIRNDELQTGIEHCHSHEGHRCYSVSADIGLVSAAHEYGLSLGKYNAYLQLAAYDNTVTVDDCRDMSMSEIHRCIRAQGQHEDDSEDNSADYSGEASDSGGHSHHGGCHE